MKIVCTEITGRDLQPGDLFSTVGQEYWDGIDGRHSIGERVYIRTDTPASFAPDIDVPVYRIEVIR